MAEEIRQFPKDRDLLTSQCEEINFSSDDVEGITEALQRTLDENRAYGVAAPQIGLRKRATIVLPGVVTPGRRRFLSTPKYSKEKGASSTKRGVLASPGCTCQLRGVQRFR